MRVLFVCSLLFSLLSVSCGADTVWGLEGKKALSLIASGDTSFMDSVSPSKYPEILRISDEAPYFAALHLVDGGLLPQAKRMLEVGLDSPSSLVRELCQAELERLFPASVPFPEDPEAWYANRPVDDALIAALSGPGRSSWSPFFTRVSLVRAAVYQKKYQEALVGTKALLSEYAVAKFERASLSDFGRSALYGSALPEEDASYLLSLLPSLDTGAKGREAAYVLGFYAARLFAQGNDPMAVEAFETILDIAASTPLPPRDYDTALYYLLDFIKDGSPSVFIGTLNRYGSLISDSSLFASLIDGFIVKLMQKRDWKHIVALRNSLPLSTDAEISVRLEYLASRSGLLSQEDAAKALKAVYEGDHSSLYYRILAAERLSLPVAEPSSLLTLRKETPETSNDLMHEAILRGFIEWNLPSRVYPYALSRYPALKREMAHELSDALSARSFQSDALRLSILSLRYNPDAVTKEELAYVYPRHYRKEIESAAERNTLSPWLLFALVRSESFFKADVVSHAGAIGLSQLMEATASDIARKLKKTGYSLVDPQTNVDFGAYYLAELIGRLDGNVLSALFSYNAGISRVRTWQRGAPDLESDLFLETLPFAETREYGRKVLAAAVVYGYLYYQKPTEEIVREIFYPSGK